MSFSSSHVATALWTMVLRSGAGLTVSGKDDFSFLRGGICIRDHLQGSHRPDSRVQSDGTFVYSRVTRACDLVGGWASQRPLEVGGQVVHAVGIRLIMRRKGCLLSVCHQVRDEMFTA